MIAVWQSEYDFSFSWAAVDRSSKLFGSARNLGVRGAEQFRSAEVTVGMDVKQLDIHQFQASPLGFFEDILDQCGR